ncbi:hypothetical protein I3760_11G018300 [Carya illinoinensis]|nr:hypothetical protein I3760_11G018300 [Carya illinoinensis]
MPIHTLQTHTDCNPNSRSLFSMTSRTLFFGSTNPQTVLSSPRPRKTPSPSSSISPEPLSSSSSSLRLRRDMNPRTLTLIYPKSVFCSTTRWSLLSARKPPSFFFFRLLLLVL